MFRSQLEIKSNNASLISEMSDFLIPSGLVLDRVRHFQPIPIHRFFAVNRYRYDTDTLQERTSCSTTDRSKTPDAAAATNNSGCGADRLQRGGGCLRSVVDSQTQQLSVKFNIRNSNDNVPNCAGRLDIFTVLLD